MNNKRNDIIRLLLSLAIVIAGAFVLSFVFFKVDLTAEKRHSLTPATEALLENLEDNLYIRCYLHGEFPAGFRHLEQNVKERLDEFRDYSNGHIEYEFIDPYESGDDKIINETFKTLDEKGLKFSNISFNENGAQANKLIWPGAIVEYQGKEYPIQFLKTEAPTPSDAMINNSVNNLEYELANSLRKITKTKKPSIAVLTGHREIEGINLADFIFGLRENYDVEPVRIDSQIAAFSDKFDGMSARVNRYDALVVAGPDSLFSDKDRFIIDQFVMNGGKVLWMLDALRINMDSLRTSQTSMAVSNENGLYEMLFEYGVRLNRTLVIDFQGAPIILDNGPMGNQRNYVDRTNYYAPLMLNANNRHPITSNLDPIKMEFAGSLDSVNPNPEVLKIPLLKSSELSKELKSPVRVDLQLLSFNQEYFMTGNQPNKTMAMILEGKFPSAFRDMLPNNVKDDPTIAYKEKSNATKMIVIADGDIAYNDVDWRGEKPLPLALGYDPQFRRVLYDNKEFLMNCMNYLLDDQALISVRSRSIELRKLDMAKVNENKTSIKISNTALPVIIIMIAGMIQFVVRRKKWTAVKS
ncbi:MAG: gliding motility-associated ABC transporter substrate-binding protein GldG [Flavobacteriales bacterium]|nr:gliding motility-associated ABC transporter substrate-binding protein GldG [Flavobacteriales bacterium]